MRVGCDYLLSPFLNAKSYLYLYLSVVIYVYFLQEWVLYMGT